jgi:hypothetical protein
MKRIGISLLIFFITYGIAYWWGVYDLKINPPVIENDGDLATLGMMPVFLHIYGIAWGIFLVISFWVYIFFRKVLNKISRQASGDEPTK